MNFKETRNRPRRDISTLQVRVKRTHPQLSKAKQKSLSLGMQRCSSCCCCCQAQGFMYCRDSNTAPAPRR